MNSDKDFEIDIFLNKRLLRNFYHHQFTSLEERENQIEEKRERWLKEKIFRLKENILYNNLESKYLSNLNLNLSNIFYFKHYLRFVTDFESINFDLLQSMRTNYLKTFFKYVEKDFTENEGNSVAKNPASIETLKKNEQLFFDFLQENSMKPKNYDLICLISSLIAVCVSPFSVDRAILLLLDNILVSVSEMEKSKIQNKNYENFYEIEKNLMILFDTFDSRIFLNSEKDKNLKALILHKLLTLALKFQSSILLIQTIYKIKESKLIYEDLKEILNLHFKKKLKNVISLPNLSENIFRNFEYSHNNEISPIYKIAMDESYIYLVIHSVLNNQKFLNILKIGSGFKNTLISKVYSEKMILLEESGEEFIPKNIYLIQKEKLNQIQVMITSKKNEIRIYGVNKNNLDLIHENYHKFIIDSNLYELIFIFNTDEDFYMLCKNLNKINNPDDLNLIRVLFLDSSSSSTSPKESKSFLIEEKIFFSTSARNFHLQKLCDLNYSNCYFSFFNRYVFFLDNRSRETTLTMAIFNLNSGKVELRNIKDLLLADNFYYNKFHNFLILMGLDENKKKIKFDYFLNKQSSPFENLDVVSVLKRKIKFSKKLLKFDKKKENLENESDSQSLEKIQNFLDNKSKITNYLLRKLVNSQFDQQTNELKFKFLEEDESKENVEAFFNLIISYFAVYVSTFGNLKNSFKSHLNQKDLLNSLNSVYNKQLHNNLSVSFFDVLWNKTISRSLEIKNSIEENKNFSNEMTELFFSVILIKTFMVNVIDLNVSIDIYLEKNLENVFKNYFQLFISLISSADKKNELDETASTSNFEKINEKQILTRELYSLLEIFIKNSNLIAFNKNFINELFKIVNDRKKSQANKILILNLIICFYEKTRIDLNLIENIIEFEFSFLKNESELFECDLALKSTSDDLISTFDFIHKFKKLFFKTFFQDICSWEMNEENNLVTHIFNLIIANLSKLVKSKEFQSIFNQSTFSKVSEYLNNFSFLTHTCLFFINIIITKSEVASQTPSYFLEKFPYAYFEKIINLMIELDKFKISSQDKKFNNLQEKSYFFETEHPCENDMKRSILFKFDDKKSEPISFKFDCMSYMNGDSKILLEYDANIFGPYNTNIPPEEKKFPTHNEPKNILLKYFPHSVGKESSLDYPYSYGFLFKCQNYNSNDNEIQIFIEIRRSFVYSLCKLVYNTLIKSKNLKRENLKGENKKEINLYKALFSSKLLENISIFKLKDLKHFYLGSFTTSHYKNLMAVIEQITIEDEYNRKLKEKCLALIDPAKISQISLVNEFSQKSDVYNEISEIISNIVKHSDDYYKKGIYLLQKFFNQKNPWGNLSGREIEHLIVYLFTIILKHERLILKYKEYLENINQEGVYENFNPGQINDIPNFNFFLRVFSECSKIRIWFNEKKMQIAEFISSKQNLGEALGHRQDMEIFSEVTEKEIEQEISNYISKITRKAEFLLEVMNCDAEEESSKRMDSSPRSKNKEYTIHVQDLIDNLMIYIKTDEVEIEKIIEKIKAQNEKAINRETALICFNILLRIVNYKQQDLRDILYWVNIIFKQSNQNDLKGNFNGNISNIYGYNHNPNSQNNLIYFNKDLYGSDTVFNLRVTDQFYNLINCLLEKVQIQEDFSFSQSNREIITHLILAQSLIWKLRKRDYIFLRTSKFFEIFLKNSIFSGVLAEMGNMLTGDSNEEMESDCIPTSSENELNKNLNLTKAISSSLKEEILEEIQYGKECINFELLHSALLQIMTVYSLQVFDKLNDEILDKSSQSFSNKTQIISPRTATTLLSLMRKRSELNEYESFKIINRITDVFLLEFEDYLRIMNDIAIGECSEKVLRNINKKEEKLNSFLILLYRCLSFNSRLISHLMKYSGDILATLYEIFLYSSEKNKYMVIKFINLLTVINYQEEFFMNSVNLIKKLLEKKFSGFSNLVNNSNLYSRKKEEFKFNASASANYYIIFLIKLIISLINSEENKNYQFFFNTDCDKEIAFELIYYLRDLTLRRDGIFQTEFKKLTRQVFSTNEKNISLYEADKQIIILILGCEFNPLRLGAKIYVNFSHDMKKVSERNLQEFTTEQSHKAGETKENRKVGVILGFTESAKNPFVVDEIISDFSYDQFSYSKMSKYALVVLEETLNRENVKNLSYDTMIIETKNLELCEINLFQSEENFEENQNKEKNGNLFKLKEFYLETKILENFMRDIFSVDLNNFEDHGKFGNLYSILKIIKNILFSKNEDLISNLLENILKNYGEARVLDKITEFALCAITMKISQSSLETLEKKLLQEILLIKEKEEEEKKRNRAASFNSESFDNFTMISPNTKSIFVKFNKNLIKEIPFVKLFNADKIIPNIQSEFYPMIRKENLLDMKTRSIIYVNCDDLLNTFSPLSGKKLDKKILAIITNEQINKKSDFDFESFKIPIVSISDSDYESTFAFIFENSPKEEYEELFLQSIQRDFSSFIDIPPQLVDETVRFGQRDLVLKLMNEEVSDVINNTSTSLSASENELNLQNFSQLLKLISLISRRILIRLISLKPSLRNHLDVTKFLKILKLLIFENNILQTENRNLSKINSENEIVLIIKEFLRSLFNDKNPENQSENFSLFDFEVVTSLMDISFFTKYNYIDLKLIINVDSEIDLLGFENIENNLKIIYYLIKSSRIKQCLSSSEDTKNFIKEYEMKLFHALIIKLDDFTIKNKETGEFILNLLIILLQHISDLIIEQKDETMKNSLKHYSFLFKSEEFLRITKKAKSIFESKQEDIKFDALDAKIINFFLIFLDLSFICLAKMDIDLNLNNFLTSKIMNLYYAYSFMTKKFKNFEFFVLFCQMKDLVDTKKYLDDHIVRQDFYYKDTNYSTPHLMRFNYESAEGVAVKITSGDKNEFDFDRNSLVLIYSNKECNSNMLQEYVNCQDVNKNILIKNNSSNQFYISLPYNGNSHSLFCCGHNEYQSLGCNLESGKIYGTPQKSVGISSKLIKSFKFGYYHCFAVGTDDKINVCGKDYASSLKEMKEHPSFTTANYFHNIAAREGVVNLWVNNYNSTIMLTRNNKLFGCGINTDCNLTNRNNIGDTTNIPYELQPFSPEIKAKVKLVACGFKTSMIVLEDGTALTFGCNLYHETGNLASTSIVKEYFRLNPPEGCKIVNAVCGEHFFLLLIQDRNNKIRLYSMGSNDNGRCGVDGDNSHRLQKCKGVENMEFRYIASRNASSAAITTTGLLYTFGSNEMGNLGHGNNVDHLRPTVVEALKDYITDDVSISHNHMLIVARDRMIGEKHLFVTGSNQYGSLGLEDLNLRVKSPKELLFFREKEQKYSPVRVSTSRYQSYLLAMDNKIQDDKNNFGIECRFCNAYIKDIMYFRPVKKDQHDVSTIKEETIRGNQDKMIVNEEATLHESEPNCEFICQMCIQTKIGSEIIYMINTPCPNIKNLKIDQLLVSKDILKAVNESEVEPPMFLNNENFSQEIDELNKNYIYECVDCSQNIKSKVYVSTFDNKLTLCHKCITNYSNKIEFPQVFYVMNKIRIKSQIKKNLPYLPELSKLLWNIEKTETPYLTIEIVPQISQLEEIRMISRDKKTFELFSKWKKMNNDYLIELNLMKDDIDIKAKEEITKNISRKNDVLTSVSDYSKLINYLKNNTESNEYKTIKMLDDEEFNMLNELSSSINESIFYLMNLTYKIKDRGILHEAITDNLSLVSSKARLNMFQERLSKLKVSVNAGDKELAINRMKAMRFYEKKVIDSNGENTIFGQMYHKLKKYPINNYLCKQENRLFFVNLTGEGATDYGGPYREVFSTACEELHSPHLDLFIKSPNNRNEVGAMRDKYIVNPGAKSALCIDMLFFFGCLIGYAISSGHLMNLNIHPKIWKLILNQQVDFTQYETIDKLFYKYINDISNTTIKNQSDFEMAYDQYFVIQMSDGSEYELIPNGKRIQVTLENKDKFVGLAKAARLNEFKLQIESIRSGLTNVIPDSIISLITHNELEELACGTPTLDVEILKQHTEYQNYRPDDVSIMNFWKVLEGFTNEEKVLYLKYVWGRSRLPDPNIFPFVHVIAKMWHSNPDTRLPSATTCYFTLKLPEYSSIDVLREKLKYVIINCSEIDADFAVTTTFEI